MPSFPRALPGRGPEWVVLAASATAIAILAALHLLNNLAGDPRLPLSVDEEGSLGAWYYTVQFFLGFVLCAAVALLAPALRRAWGVLALVLLALSADDGTQVHHKVEGTAGTTFAVLGWQPLAIAVIA